MWIWQQSDWPAFRYDQNQLNPLLREVHFLQGVLLGRIGGQGETECQQVTLDTMLANILTSSAIEGERLNHSVVRSSLARKLGIPVVAVVDTNCSPKGVDYVIPGNDDAARAIALYCDLISRAALEGMSAQLGAAGVDIGALEVAPEEEAVAEA